MYILIYICEHLGSCKKLHSIDFASFLKFCVNYDIAPNKSKDIQLDSPTKMTYDDHVDVDNSAYIIMCSFLDLVFSKELTAMIKHPS